MDVPVNAHLVGECVFVVAVDSVLVSAGQQSTVTSIG